MIHAVASYLGPRMTPAGPRQAYLTACKQPIAFPPDKMPQIGSSVRLGEGDESCPHCFPVRPQAAPPAAPPRAKQNPDEEDTSEPSVDDSLGDLEHGDDMIISEERDQWGEKSPH